VRLASLRLVPRISRAKAEAIMAGFMQRVEEQSPWRGQRQS